MFDDICAIFYNNIAVLLDRYIDSRESNKFGRDDLLRSSLELAGALFHFREHLPPELARSRADVEAACPDYRLVADVVNATKHAKITKKTPSGKSLVSSSVDIYECIILVIYNDELGEYSDIQNFVQLNCGDGVTRYFDGPLISVFNYWSDTLHDAGVVSYPNASAAQLPGSYRVLRKDVRKVDIETLNTMRFRSTFRLLEYDDRVGSAVPLDMQGKNFKFRVFKITNIIDFTASIPGFGDVTVDVTISDEYAKKLHFATTESQINKIKDEIFQLYKGEIFEKARAFIGKSEVLG